MNEEKALLEGLGELVEVATLVGTWEGEVVEENVSASFPRQACFPRFEWNILC